MKADTLSSLTEYHWTPQPEAEQFVHQTAATFIEACSLAATLQQRLRAEAGVRFIDLIDTFLLPADSQTKEALETAGYQKQPAIHVMGECFIQPHGIFPRVVLGKIEKPRVYMKVESAADFDSVWQTDAAIEGEPLAPLRMACVSKTSGSELYIVERHGYQGFEVQPLPASGETILKHADQFRRRPRRLPESEGFDAAEKLLKQAIEELGVNYACDLFFAAERDFWQRRNRAGQVQKSRQDRLGIGWANHDHHTYRSSRKYFQRMIGLFELLGFHCRERFYAGKQAGWGAQVLEQPETGIVIFADVDLSPDELVADFSHEPLAARHELGTVGLWCGLHGESFLNAGMHHLECQFAFDDLKSQLMTEAGVDVMKPFTDFPYLRQAFTEGERWPVAKDRIARLLSEGKISSEQAAAFEREGAIGSHLENLERNAGFKGFNQTGVSEIISATDPRKHVKAAAL